MKKYAVTKIKIFICTQLKKFSSIFQNYKQFQVGKLNVPGYIFPSWTSINQFLLAVGFPW
jgi:hypothetical protein